MTWSPQRYESIGAALEVHRSTKWSTILSTDAGKYTISNTQAEIPRNVPSKKNCEKQL